ncbi:hypothetical protein [Rhizobium sp. 9140]|uniref:hypothetical protein n=1 Tax=Rhizobium sp. 9140 TaxID=1761900 RepID=UPI0007997E15|nr:hypothetical protein [Rhizobium sp. 9140]CZT36114.1 hypothetical protein GA0004734_00031160 [Rhizobium sp. 9140]
MVMGDLKTPHDHVYFEIRMAYSLSPQYQKRGFGGSKPGKGRQPRVILQLAKAMAARLDYALTFAPHSVADLERVICSTMEAYAPEAAYETVIRDGNKREEAQRFLTGRVTDDLIAAFTFEKKAFTGLHPITASSYPPGWNWQERLKNGEL